MITNRRSGADDGDVPSGITSALQHTRRRAAVERLLAYDGALSLIALAGRLATHGEGKLPNVVIELHDRHLPELIDRGLVEYDPDTGTVTLDADPDVVEAALDRVSDGRS